MNVFNNCPRCGSLVQKVTGTQICECGWHSSETKDSSQKNIVFSLFLIAGVIAVLGFHVFQWGQHSVAILTAQPERKLSICMNLKKYDCVEKAYEDIYLQKRDIENLEKLAEFQFRREKYNDSYNTYKIYFSKNGKSKKAMYYYAHALAKNGQIDESINYFEALTKSGKDTLMVTVIESYLQVLMFHNRVNKAKELLSWAEKIARNSNSKRYIEKWHKQFNI